MGRRKIATWDRGHAEQMAEFVGANDPPKPKPKSRLTKKQIQAHLATVESKMTDRDWEDYTPSLVVALFMWCHQQTYGVAALELEAPAVFNRARMQAARQRTDHFQDDVTKQLEFMRWVWRRERGYEEWRRTNSKPGRTIAWYRQFVSDELITQYRIDLARNNGHG